MLDFVRCFSEAIDTTMWLLCSVWFLNVKLSLNKAQWITVSDSFSIFLESVFCILLKFAVSLFLRDVGTLLALSLTGFGILVRLAS